MSHGTPGSHAPPAILVVDDDETVLRNVQRVLRHHGFAAVETCADGRQVPDLLARRPYALLLLDLMMPGVRGEEILAQVASLQPALPVVVVTAEQDVRSVVHCMQLGAADYLVKPVSAEELIATVRKTLDQQDVRLENERLRDRLLTAELERPATFAAILTRDPSMLRMFSYLEAIARGSQPVLIIGETGSGKELVARAVHTASDREGPFVAVNVAGLDDTVFSDTLFGHRAGAFTGAVKDRPGLVETAGTGTLFLDEIGDLTEASQVKLLRLIQEREYLPLGADTPRRLRARVVAATHREPTRLRQDLYYRLRSHQVRIPPLRERPGDLPLLVERFVREAAADLGIAPPRLPPELAPHLASYAFPGNVRELQALIHDAVARQRKGLLSLEAVREHIGPPHELPPLGVRAHEAQHAPAPTATESAGAATGDGVRILTRGDWRQLERDNILAALDKADWQVSAAGGAAELLGMKPSTLTSRMKALGIRRPPS